MNNYLAFIILAFCFGLVFTGSAQEFSRTMPQIQGQELGYMNSYYPTYYPSYSSAYWNYPYIPAKIAVQDAKERLYANKYMNPDSAWWQVQEAKERLWTVKNPCYACWQDQEYGWRGRNRFGESMY
jgi:hypothetical protein